MSETRGLRGLESAVVKGQRRLGRKPKQMPFRPMILAGIEIERVILWGTSQ